VVPKDRPMTPRERVAAAFFKAFSVETSEEMDGAFERELAAAFRAIDVYDLERGWRPPEKTAKAESLALFVAAD
jgi:hypothetical protein